MSTDKSERSKGEYIPAIPPADYKGSVAQWMVALQERGLWDGEGWYGNEMIEEEDWWQIVDECEK